MSRTRKDYLKPVLGTFVCAATLAAVVAACGDSGGGGNGTPDSGTSTDANLPDAGRDATSPPVDAGADSGAVDAGAVDAGAGADATGNDGSADASQDAPPDVGVDAPVDAGHDAAILPYGCGTPVTYGAGPQPQSPALADLDHDGHLDIAIVDHTANYLGVYLNLPGGGGTFASIVTYPTANGSNPHTVAAADINGDGWQDLATTGSGVLTVHINAAAGDGVMRAGVSTPYGGAGLGGDGLAFADFNGDDKVDFAGPNLARSAVSILLNTTTDAGVAWGPEATYTAGAGSDLVSIGDLAGNGHSDLAVANLNDQTVTILFGQGNGSFAFDELLNIGGLPSTYSADGAIIADLNKDGAPDLVVEDDDVTGAAGDGGDAGTYGFLVFLNKNDHSGRFLAPIPYVVAGGGGPGAVFDMNGDGWLDVVAAGAPGVTVFLNQGDPLATLVASTTCPAGNGVGAIAAGDLNGDGKGDVVVANDPNAISVLLGR
jgi:hypothetical protein